MRKTMLCGVMALVVTLGGADAALACGRCGFAVCRYQVHVVEKERLVPVATDLSFHVSYTLHFPPPAAAGTTGFAYTPAQVSFLDPALFLNSASRYLETAQSAAQKGFGELNQSAALVLDGQRSVAEVQARAALLTEAAKLMASTAPSGGAPLPLRASRDADGRLRIEAAALPQPSADLRTIITNKCVRCHGPAKAEAGLNLANLGILDPSYDAKILDRISTADPARRMPKGGTLTPDEIAVFFRASQIGGKP
jgi:hypothetical protein